ncbi:hypothetical protein QTP88_018720 [Uroleucon formosanum]
MLFELNKKYKNITQADVKLYLNLCIPCQQKKNHKKRLTPTKQEIYNIIKKLKNNKSPGENNVVAELLKNGGNAIKDEIWKMIKEIWETEVMPGEWNTAILCPIFKKGDTLDPKNYRGISLLDTCYKILSTLLLERITPYAEGIIGRYHCGFIKGKSTIDHIFTLRQTMEKYYEFDMDLYMIFVDYKQAYDSVNRQELWKAMLHFGIPKKYVNLVNMCNNKTVLKVRFLQTLSPAFEVNSGLRQGDALSPTLFNLGLEKVIREAYEDRRMEVIGEETILAYADDIVLLGNTREEISHSLSKLIEVSKNMGLCINEEKTKLMILSRRNVDQSNLKVGSMNFEKVDNFKYLGVNINNSNNMHKEIKERISNGNRCYFSINKLLRSKLLSRKSKTTLYTSYLRPVVTYGCETWSTTKDNNKKLAISERKILSNIYGPVYNDNLGIYEKRHNEELYNLYEKPNILTYIRCKRLEWLGHVWRADGDLLKNVLIRKINKKRPLGRPRTRWKDTAEKDKRLIDEDATLDWTLNREKWRGLLVAAQVLNGPLSC